MTIKDSKQILVLGTSTDIGKTYVSCKLIENTFNNNRKIKAIKPVVTGFNINDENCDTIRILKNLNLDINSQSIDNISPFRLKAPVSPISAAKHEGITINYQEVLDFCKKKIEESKKNDHDLIIEAAGGVMTPICPGKSFLDLAQDLEIEIILVGACYLGGISAILSAYENLQGRNCNKTTILVNNHLDYDKKHLKINDFIGELADFIDCDVFLVEKFFK